VVKTADIVDELGGRVQSCETQLRDLGAVQEYEGTIRTLRCYEDNALVRVMVSQHGDGRVLVVDGGGSLRTALLGDVLAKLACDNGWSGLIFNGAVRDTEALAGIAVGIKALGTNPMRSSKNGAGEIDIPVSFGGVTFSPGSYVWADEDGVVVRDRPR